MWIGNDGVGDVSATTGLCIAKTDPPIVMLLQENVTWIDAGTSTDGLTFMRAD